MVYIFIWYTYGNVDIDNFLSKYGQTLHRLTFEKSYMHYIVARREYTVSHIKLDKAALLV
jgi:hypothetical protein